MDSEQRLIKKSIQGDKNAFGKLVKLFQDQILLLTADYLGNYEEAKDAAQDVFIKAFEKLESYNQNSKFKTWLYRIAINTSIDYLRKRKSMQKLHNETENDLFKQSNIPKNDIWDDNFSEAMNILSENQYTAIILKYFHSNTTKEISEILNCDINTVRIHLYRGIQKLKQNYTKSDLP